MSNSSIKTLLTSEIPQNRIQTYQSVFKTDMTRNPVFSRFPEFTEHSIIRQITTDYTKNIIIIVPDFIIIRHHSSSLSLSFIVIVLDFFVTATSNNPNLQSVKTLNNSVQIPLSRSSHNTQCSNFKIFRNIMQEGRRISLSSFCKLGNPA